MERFLKSGSGWRVGWRLAPAPYQGLVGTDEWAIELTAAEFEDFCRLSEQLAQTMGAMSQQLMVEEAIAVEAHSDRLWLEAEGYPHAYSLRFILQSGRNVEGSWSAAVVPELLQALRSIQVW
jgi:hypothetical protein